MLQHGLILLQSTNFGMFLSFCFDSNACAWNSLFMHNFVSIFGFICVVAAFANDSTCMLPQVLLLLLPTCVLRGRRHACCHKCCCCCCCCCHHCESCCSCCCRCWSCICCCSCYAGVANVPMLPVPALVAVPPAQAQA